MRRRELLLAAAGVALARAARADGEEAEAGAVARWLAGAAGLAASTAPPSAEWLAYAAAEDARWARTGARILAMRAWSKRELASLVPRDRPVLYPFGGPDALHALALFPSAPRMLLIGLEPVAPLPDVAYGARAGYFADVGAAMLDLHDLTFFRTRDLATDLACVGVLPPLLATVVRMGGVVTSFSRIGAGRASIEWRSSDEEPRLLEYVQVDLSNAGLARRTDIVATLRGLSPHVTFLKAASYLLAEERFSYLRRLVLEDSAVLVQDDTGVPFRELDGRWATRLFGRYVAPSSPFADRAQRDLERAYARESPASLPFAIGYHSRASHSNLLVAARGSA